MKKKADTNQMAFSTPATTDLHAATFAQTDLRDLSDFASRPGAASLGISLSPKRLWFHVLAMWCNAYQRTGRAQI